MKLGRCVITVLLLFVGGGGQSLCASDSKDIETWVTEFCQPATAPKQKDSLRRKLVDAPRKPLSKAVEKALGDVATRGGALELISSLRLPGFFDAAKPLLKTEHEARAIDAIFLSRDKGADKFLYERWLKSAPDSPSFKIVDAAFRLHPASLDCIEDLRALLSEESKADRAPAARAILQYQMALTADEAKQLPDGWKPLVAAFQLRNRSFQLTGRDLLHEGEWNRRIPEVAGGDDEPADPAAPPDDEEAEEPLVVPYRDRVILRPGGTYTLDGVNWRNLTLTVWVLVLEGKDMGVGIIMEKGNALVGPSFNGSAWVVPSGQGSGRADGSIGKWAEVVLTLQGTNATVTVDGTPVISKIPNYGSKCKGVRISAGSGSVLVGAVALEGGK